MFKSSGRYGLQMASFLPTLLHFDHWSLTADLLWGKKRRPFRSCCAVIVVTSARP